MLTNPSVFASSQSILQTVRSS